jgi:hypothetical protein
MDNNNIDNESETSLFSESSNSVDHCLEVQDEMINALQSEIKELNKTIDLLKKICKVTWDKDAFNGIIEYL